MVTIQENGCGPLGIGEMADVGCRNPTNGTVGLYKMKFVMPDLIRHPEGFYIRFWPE